ncbi:hypothetical protein [Mycobacterium simiae]|uniref:hypothetical protein n=1 Tax=Mycobacterium simiae TaxID=1784 RepID=UPI0004104103|nr:hypothetical protein [Mycobacterium simiae]PLV50883.1 hypothetical protein X011_12105 [Mycobacterium tuberculosis variant microti OV254]BBX43137.1 hypothetical protein MSIM_45880 [Mycobacterium simiae]
MAIENWDDAPEIHPSDVRVGDVIGTLEPSRLRYTVKMIGGPQKSPGKWTFFCRDAGGLQHTSTVRDDQLIRRYAKAG